MPDIQQKISLKYDSLTGAQRQVADYFNANLHAIAFKTLDELAMQIGVSTTTVIRFARYLGYQGYADMLQDIQSSMINQMSLPERLSSSEKYVKQDQLFMDSFQNDIENITATLTALSEKDLSGAVDAIIGATTIYVLGVRGTFSLSHYLGYRLSQIKKGVRIIQATGMTYPEEILSAKQGDVCIGFLMPRYSKMTLTMVKVLRKQGVKIILFTDQNKPEEIHSYGDIILASRIKGISYKKSMVAPMCICNYLLAAVALKDHDHAMEMLAKTEEMIKDEFFLGL